MSRHRHEDEHYISAIKNGKGMLDEADIVTLFERGHSKESLAKMVEKRNGVKPKEALNAVETAIYKMLICS